VEGIVIRSTGSWHTVRTESGDIFDCKLKGLFRIKGLKATNPVTVGDRVECTAPEGQNYGSIFEIKPRKNYIIRKSTKLSKSIHILAANIDQAFVVATLILPRTSTGFIDRFLVTAEAYKIPVTILFNKTDLYNPKLMERQRELCELYKRIGYKSIGVSALEGTNMALVRDAMLHKICLIAGHSGVGKSAIINYIDPGLKLRTGDISYYHQKGKHTTTFTEMHPLSFGGYVIDTPGIKEFGLVDFYREELTHYFPEMFRLLEQCQFHNCTHIHEPRCAVRDAVESGEISESRYTNYLNIFYGKELEEEEWD
jgi:ribosome biogenesis GTPase / thiamine phosphate phosphatase